MHDTLIDDSEARYWFVKRQHLAPSFMAMATGGTVMRGTVMRDVLDAWVTDPRSYGGPDIITWVQHCRGVDGYTDERLRIPVPVDEPPPYDTTPYNPRAYAYAIGYIEAHDGLSPLNAHHAARFAAEVGNTEHVTMSEIIRHWRTSERIYREEMEGGE